MLKIRWYCKRCGRGLSLSTVWIDNGGAYCKAHAEALMADRYGANAGLIGTVKAMTLKQRREAA